jgi:hypothetical protein
VRWCCDCDYGGSQCRVEKERILESCVPVLLLLGPWTLDMATPLFSRRPGFMDPDGMSFLTSSFQRLRALTVVPDGLSTIRKSKSTF